MLQIIKVGTMVIQGATRYMMHFLIPENPCTIHGRYFALTLFAKDIKTIARPVQMHELETSPY